MLETGSDIVFYNLIYCDIHTHVGCKTKEQFFFSIIVRGNYF